MTTGTNAHIKVLVVDDSAFMRKVISDMLNSDEKIKVIGTAKNAKEAIDMALALRPDAITLDIEMPEMDGLGCLKRLKEICDIPVLMLSSLTQSGSEATIKALELGAIDFVTKPTNIFQMNNNEKKAEIINKVRFIGELRHKENGIKTENEVKDGKTESSNVINTANKHSGERKIKKIVAIGISTGGPKALREVIPFIPADIPAAILIVQHMLPGFTKSLAERFNSISEIEVKEAENDEIIKAGCVYIAPGDNHMEVRMEEDNTVRIKITDVAPVGGHRPAVNVLLDSISKTNLSNIIAVIMTGMGGDGSEGIKKVKKNNKGYIIAQDEKTSIVFGMPRVAIETGVVDAVVPLGEIAKEIIRIVEV